MERLVPIPSQGRTFVESRRVRLTDMDARGRLRLDAVARFLQEIAIDDVDETGWGAPEHLWFVRRMRVDMVEPFLADRAVELVTWCSGLATIAAGRRWSLTGDRGGRIEVDSVWISPRRATTPGTDHALRCLRRGRGRPRRVGPAAARGPADRRATLALATTRV
jgi:acyl-ACP thioesterase